MLFRLKPLSGDTIAVPQIVFSRLGNTDESSLRIALYILATGIVDPATIAQDLKLRSKQTAERGLLFWAGAGLLEQYTDTVEPLVETPKAMTWQEIASASRTDPMISSLIECTQTSFGRTLSHADLQRLVALYLQDGFHPETIMLCVSYLSTHDKRTIAALRHSLKSWQDDGVVTGEDADKHLQLLALREKREMFISSILGISIESFTLGGRKAIARWYENYGYDDVIIQEALLQSGAKKDIWYINTILKSWHSKGFSSVHDVRGNGANSSGESRNIRVDRQPENTGFENTFLAPSPDRPRRLKRKD